MSSMSLALSTSLRYILNSRHRQRDLLDKLLPLLPEETGEEEEGDRIRVAVIGKPNTGKSSLVNRMTGEERAIVSIMPGPPATPLTPTLRTSMVNLP